MNTVLRRLPCAILGALLCSASLRAFDIDSIPIHGSVSETAAYSDKYNFYGATDDRLHIIQSELTVNGAYRFENGIRTNVQVYAYKLDGTSDLTLDLATVDYSYRDWLGIRVGRNKHVSALYVESMDVDQIRTFASLPLGYYPRSYRALQGTTDGLTLYGNIKIGKSGGSFDYTAFIGRTDTIHQTSILARAQSSIMHTNTILLPKLFGGSIVWNAPIEGLKFSYTYSKVNLEERGGLRTRAELAAADQDLSAPSGIDAAFGAGTWDLSGMFAGQPTDLVALYTEHNMGVEYSTGPWVFAAELKLTNLRGKLTIRPLGLVESPTNAFGSSTYGMVTYQATKKVGLGVYYAYDDTDRLNANSAPKYLETSKDAAAAISYAVKPWWFLKAEYHRINGLSLLSQAGDINLNAPGAGTSWNYIVLKTTVTF